MVARSLSRVRRTPAAAIRVRLRRCANGCRVRVERTESPVSCADAALERLRRFNGWFRSNVSATRPSKSAVRGIRVSGYFSDESGWGAAGRGYVRALQRLRVPMAVHDVSALTTNRSEDRSL